jgi:hypothetical protein
MGPNRLESRLRTMRLRERIKRGLTLKEARKVARIAGSMVASVAVLILTWPVSILAEADAKS